MGRTSKTEKERFKDIVIPSYIKESAKFVIPADIETECLTCQQKYNTSKLFIGKLPKCEKCSSSNLIFNKLKLENIMLESVINDGEYKEDEENFSDECELSNEELKALKDAGEYQTILKKLDDKRRFEYFTAWKKDSELINSGKKEECEIAEEDFKQANIFFRGNPDIVKRYEKRLNEFENENVKENVNTEIKNENVKLDLPDLPEDERLIIEQSLKTIKPEKEKPFEEMNRKEIIAKLDYGSKHPEEWQKPDGKKLSASEIKDIEEMFKSFDLNEVADIIINCEENIFEIATPNQPLTEKEISRLKKVWLNVLKFYLKDLGKLLKYFPLVLLLITHLMLITSRIDYVKQLKNRNKKESPKEFSDIQKSQEIQFQKDFQKSQAKTITDEQIQKEKEEMKLLDKQRIRNKKVKK